MARVAKGRKPDPGWERVDGAGIQVEAIPDYLGPYQYLLRASALARAVRAAYRSTDAVILRVPSHLATSLASCLEEPRHPYDLEVSGDPHEFAPGAVDHILRGFFQWWFTREMT